MITLIYCRYMKGGLLLHRNYYVYHNDDNDGDDDDDDNDKDVRYMKGGLLQPAPSSVNSSTGLRFIHSSASTSSSLSS